MQVLLNPLSQKQKERQEERKSKREKRKERERVSLREKERKHRVHCSKIWSAGSKYLTFEASRGLIHEAVAAACDENTSRWQ